MTGFTLDTSGSVEMPNGIMFGPSSYRWPDLSPFAQGYVEALFASLGVDLLGEWLDRVDPYRAPGFSDLAPETLAAILKDCEQAVDYRSVPFGRWFNPNDAGGRCFWADRQNGAFADRWPPLTAYLDNDGKVRLKAAAEVRAMKPGSAPATASPLQSAEDCGFFEAKVLAVAPQVSQPIRDDQP